MKGMSELIGIVLMIAFVIAAAVIFSDYSTGFAREQLGRSQRESGLTADCGRISVSILEDSITRSGTTLRVTVRNTGTIEASDVDVVYRVVGQSNFMTADLNETVAAGAIETLETDVAGGVSDVIVTTICPGESDQVRNESGTFKRVA